MNPALIGKRLVVLRGSRSQEQVAAALNISVSALSMYEQGTRVPRDDIKIKLANYFGVTVQSLFFSL